MAGTTVLEKTVEKFVYKADDTLAFDIASNSEKQSISRSFGR